MPSPNQNSADMKAWLAKANAAGFEPSRDFGNPAGDSNQENYTSTDIPDSDESGD